MRLALLTAIVAVPALAAAQYGQVERRPMDLRVTARSGILTYTGEAARYTTPGVAYGVSVGTDINRWLAGELQYQGAAYGTEARNVPGNPTIVENGLRGILRLGPARGDHGAEPYALTGFGIDALDVRGENDESGPVQDATLLDIPVGVGIDYRVPDTFGRNADLLIGTRALYDVVVQGGAFEDDASANRLQATIQAGAQF